MLTFLIAVAAVALFVLGMSITLMIKGRNLQSDVGSNDDMKRLGLECASESARREQADFCGQPYAPNSGCSTGICGTCEVIGKDKK